MINACGVYVRCMSYEEDEWKAYILISHSEKRILLGRKRGN